ncbi:MAG: 30S ribosomal protein S4 [Flavobacteriales bacterium]|nr:30S ribosomal protein S4 [Flavobacteriales bacterium]
MSRYRGPSCKICRRAREKLFLKGAKCYSAKCAIEKRNYPPGQHTGSGRRLSEYGIRLREKQKLRFCYGVSGKQIQLYFKRANSQKGQTGHNLLFIFEKRLDNVIYRANLASSRQEARQLVLHGHFDVDGEKVNVPSFLVKAGMRITVRKKSQDLFKSRFAAMKGAETPAWIGYDSKLKEVNILQQPKREEIDVPVKEQLVVEYYSR